MPRAVKAVDETGRRPLCPPRQSVHGWKGLEMDSVLEVLGIFLRLFIALGDSAAATFALKLDEARAAIVVRVAP